MGNLKFPTLLIMTSTSFFLGLLFSLFPYDYPLLWEAGPVPAAHLDAVEANYKLLYHCPKICFQIFHFMILVGLGALIAKLYKPSESNMLFDGGSLVLFMVAVIIYLSNIAKGLRIVDRGVYGIGMPDQPAEGEQESGVPWGKGDGSAGSSVLGREDNLKVLGASNTILALVLLGVLVLQVGQWYAERADEKTMKEYAEKEAQEAKEAAGKSDRATSPKEGRKNK
ncbi:uncharacterized protein HMPREF1541_06426 [Cyphellophora europaea CBS 101466]|uniref:ER membrane protein SH3 n=1 Tax=Cyphellophora europaea (strain CBS 101466) TaxID=1220924 RepID=W2RPG9_CYPE1|nr:uncharacterized protein HMPREF1541_06426 [Cyphellophora europaea CBS 101466]ETN38391.1 hypothetical protein HMPREF1541_06426 [Cyphellophora europaea CBS 101466]